MRLGEQNLVRTDDRANPRDIAVEAVITHPSYKTSSHYSDIAVVKLTEAVVFNKFIRPACLWQNHDVNSTRAVATGWGQVEFCECDGDRMIEPNDRRYLLCDRRRFFPLQPAVGPTIC